MVCCAYYGPTYVASQSEEKVLAGDQCCLLWRHAAEAN
jgi:hypothetical protein